MESMRNTEYVVSKGNPLPLGVSKVGNRVQFAISVPNQKECKLNLYLVGNEVASCSFILDESMKIGSVFSVMIENLPYRDFEYMYEVNGKEFIDPYARKINGKEEWGRALTKTEETHLRGTIMFDYYEWNEDKSLCIPFSEAILYQLHVRGFTKHSSSKVKNKGTFKGIEEKIEYFKELGINGLVLMPIYEFDEVIKEETKGGNLKPFVNYSEVEATSIKLNYWGYGKVINYFTPKASYASDKSNPISEFKDLVKALHSNGIELILEMCFEKGTNPNMILDCLRYWVLEYHVDGFRLNDDVVPTNIVATDPILAHIKLLCTYWNVCDIYEGNMVPAYKNLAEYNDGFLVDSRRFLKSDEEQVDKFIGRIKKNPGKCGVINYITNMNGFTLMDLVSYDIKHNEKNGENGRDGTDYNYSWNCGIEGKTKRKNVMFLRKKQIRNGLLMLILSQGTPMIRSGDEFGNTCEGNNNAYCQDNAISWINWNQLVTNKDMFLFLKQIIKLRRDHKILHMFDELRVMDYISCGYPDISFHSTKAWYPDLSNYSRVLGVMLCGKYVKLDRKTFDDDFYIAFNMHWETHEFDLPKLPENKVWEVLIDTSMEKGKEEPLVDQKNYLVKSRTIIVLIGRS